MPENNVPKSLWVDSALSFRKSMSKAIKSGQMVSWNNSGGRAEGKVMRLVTNGTYSVPNSSFSVTGTKEDPAAVIRLYRNGEPTDTIVGHKVKSLSAK